MTMLLGHSREHGFGTGEKRPQLSDPLDMRVGREFGVDRRAERPDVVLGLVTFGARTAAAAAADEVALQILQQTAEDELIDVCVGSGMGNSTGVGTAEGDEQEGATPYEGAERPLQVP